MELANKYFRHILSRPWFPYFLIVGSIILLYGKTLAFSFTDSDDLTLLRESHRLLATGSTIRAFFGRPLLAGVFNYFYRPLLLLSFVGEAVLGGQTPFVYHLDNLIIHSTACCLLFVVLRRLRYGKIFSLFGTLVFAVHPALVPAVAWISGRNDSLLAVFLFSSFIALVRFAEMRRGWYLVFHLLFLSAALLTKETAVAAFIVFAFYIVVIKRAGYSFAYQGGVVLGWLATAALWDILRISAVGLKKMPLRDIVVSLFQSRMAVIQYIGKSIMPFQLSVKPYVEDMSITWGGIAIVLAVIAVLFARRKRRGYLFFGMLWFFLFLIPSSVSQTVYYEHRLYVPFVGILIVIYELASSWRFVSRHRLAIAGSIVLVFSGISFTYSDSFMNKRSYWENAATTSPRYPVAHDMLAGIYARDYGRYDLAERELRRSVALDPANFDGHLKLALFYADRKQFLKADRIFRSMIASESTFVNAQTDIVYYYSAELCGGDMAETEKLYRKAIELNPRVIDYYRGLADFYIRQNKPSAAGDCVVALRQRSKENGSRILFINPAAQRWFADKLSSSNGR